jgi:ubiquinone/menaquinone biosynthesis C-methylase UbiE
MVLRSWRAGNCHGFAHTRPPPGGFLLYICRILTSEMERSSFLNPSYAVRALEMQGGERVADFGAGSGFFTRAAAREAGVHGVVWAVDCHQDLLSRIKNLALGEGLHNVEVVHGNVEKPRGSHLPEANFDAVIISNVLFGADRRHEVVREARRILRPGGRALVIDWRESFAGMGPHPDHVITAKEAQELFEAEGFLHIEDVPVGAYHWGFIAKKK